MSETAEDETHLIVGMTREECDDMIIAMATNKNEVVDPNELLAISRRYVWSGANDDDEDDGVVDLPALSNGALHYHLGKIMFSAPNIKTIELKRGSQTLLRDVTAETAYHFALSQTDMQDAEQRTARETRMLVEALEIERRDNAVTTYTCVCVVTYRSGVKKDFITVVSDEHKDEALNDLIRFYVDEPRHRERDVILSKGDEQVFKGPVASAISFLRFN